MDNEEKVDNKSKDANNAPTQDNHSEHPTTRSTELLKRLAEFTSKKEDILNKLSAISERMEKRIAESNKNDSLTENDGSDIPDFRVNTPEIVESVKFCRVRETNEPLVSGGHIVLFMPKASAINDDWKARSTMNDNLYPACVDNNVKEDGITLPNNGHCLRISTGVRLSLPEGYMAHFESLVGGTTIIGPSMMLDSDKQEVSVILKNITSEYIKIEFDKAVILVTLMKATNVYMEELLNSTFESWIQGKVH